MSKNAQKIAKIAHETLVVAAVIWVLSRPVARSFSSVHDAIHIFNYDPLLRLRSLRLVGDTDTIGH